MGIESLKVVSLVQNKYNYRVFKRKIYKPNLVFCCAIFLVLITSLFSLKYYKNNYTSDIISTISYITNPVNPLYSDMGDIVFTSNNKLYKLDSKVSEFGSPVVYNSYNINEDGVEFLVSGPLLKSVQQGVVEDIYIIGNNIKCVKVKHSRNVYSVIENVDVLGVNIGALVKQGQKIGTVKDNSTIKLSIFENGEQKQIFVDGCKLWIG